MSVDPKTLLSHCPVCDSLTYHTAATCPMRPPEGNARSLWRRATDWLRSPGPRREPPDTRRRIPPQGGSGTAPPRGRSVMTPLAGDTGSDDDVRAGIAARILAANPRRLTPEQLESTARSFQEAIRRLGVGMEEFARQFREAVSPATDLNGLLAVFAHGPPVNSEEFTSWSPDAETFAQSLVYFGRRPNSATVNAVADWCLEGDGTARLTGLLAAVVQHAYDKGVADAGAWLVSHSYAPTLADRMKRDLVADYEDEDDNTEPPDPPVCDRCDGTGQVEGDYRPFDRPVYLPCPACNANRCPDCGGSGWVIDPGNVDVGGTRLPTFSRCPRGCINMAPPAPPPQPPAWPGVVRK